MKNSDSSAPPSPQPVAELKRQFAAETARATVRMIVGCVMFIFLSFLGWGISTIQLDLKLLTFEFAKRTPRITSTLVSTSAPIETPTSVIVISSPSPTVISTDTPFPPLTPSPTSIVVSSYTPVSSIPVPILLTPIDGASIKGGRPELVWQPMTLPSNYHFQVCLHHTYSGSPINICDDTTDYRRIPHSLPAEAYGWWKWKVLVINASGDIVAESETRRFWYEP